MLKIKECKALARRTLAGKYKTVIGAYFVNLAISCVMWILTAVCAVYTLFAAGLFGDGTFSFVKVTAGVMAAIAMSLASLFVGMWFDIGTTKLMLNICRGDKYRVGDVFYGFRSGSNTIGYILTGFVIWMITFGINIAARILAGLSGLVFGSDTTAGISVELILTTAFTLLTAYVMTCLMLAKIIIADKPGTGIGQALSRSRELMRGRMLKGVWLMYFSFILWDILTVVCSIAALWIIPYITCTLVIFYMDADGTLWQLPDPDRDRARSKSAANADGSESVSNEADSSTAAGISGAGSSENETAAGTASVQNEYGNSGASAAGGTAGEDFTQGTADDVVGDDTGTAADNMPDETDTQESADYTVNVPNSDVQTNQDGESAGQASANMNNAVYDNTEHVCVTGNDAQDHSGDIRDGSDLADCRMPADVHDSSAETARDAAAADNSAESAADTVRDGEASGSDEHAEKNDETDRKSDSWEQTISEMHIELPEGFNKTDI